MKTPPAPARTLKQPGPSEKHPEPDDTSVEVVTVTAKPSDGAKPKPEAGQENPSSQPETDSAPSDAQDDVSVDVVTVTCARPAADTARKPKADLEAKPPQPELASTAPVKASAEEQQSASGFLSRVRRMRRYSTTLATAAISLFIGMVIGQIEWSTSEPPPVFLKKPSDQETKFVSVDSRRHEPIQPLMPFTDLDRDVVALGSRLFHDPGLSGNGQLSCASCHDPSHGGMDGLPRSRGASGQVGEFNAPSILTAAGNFAQSWTGRAGTLEQHLELHLVEPNRMLSSWERVTKFLTSEPTYVSAFKKHLGGEPTPERIRTALATFERSLVPFGSAFDRWLEGHEAALSSDAYGGYFLFKKLNCISCHQGPGVGGSMYQPLGRMKDYFGDPNHAELQGRYRVTGLEADRYVFRVPQLRLVAQTAPYFHDGSAKTLEKAVAAMIRYQCNTQVNSEDVRRLTAFLKTL